MKKETYEKIEKAGRVVIPTITYVLYLGLLVGGGGTMALGILMAVIGFSGIFAGLTFLGGAILGGMGTLGLGQQINRSVDIVRTETPEPAQA